MGSLRGTEIFISPREIMGNESVSPKFLNKICGEISSFCSVFSKDSSPMLLIQAV